MNNLQENLKDNPIIAPESFEGQDALTRKRFFDALVQEIKPFRRLMSFYQCAVMEVETKFRVLNEGFSIGGESNPIESIKTRIKSIESLATKMEKRQITPSVENIEKYITDVAGVRVICAFPEDIYHIEKSLLLQDDVKLVERKDYIANPKPNGYRSLHLIIEVPIFLQNEKRLMKVEVQLRTIAMDFWASLEHKLRYKKNLDEALLDDLHEGLISCAEQSAALDMKMQELRGKIERYMHVE
ncbi:MAG: GTP pyrophosphokinase family protein [Oscillospiraceae bacterium]|nr:GTP pyrophosphokinase family protein [Oscillospiraceae bacterium]